MVERVTLKTIANALGVTTTTVHRALHGKEGISDELRARVRHTANEMGYRANYMAAALKRKGIRLAIALPAPTSDSRYYYRGMWRGLRRFFSETAEFNVTPLEYSYRFMYGANGKALKNIYEEHAGKLDGVLTIGVEGDDSHYYIHKLRERGIPIVLLGNDMYRDARLCCVSSCDEMAGSLAAGLLAVIPEPRVPRKVIVAGHFGQLGMIDQLNNIGGFEHCLKSAAPHITTVHVRGEDRDGWLRDLERALLGEKDICAIYTCSARYTVYLATLLEKMGLAGKLSAIGNDLCTESAGFLRSGTLTAVIDKKISRQSYLAAKTLFDYAVKSELPRSDVLRVRPEVILRGSLGLAGDNALYDENAAFDDILPN